VARFYVAKMVLALSSIHIFVPESFRWRISASAAVAEAGGVRDGRWRASTWRKWSWLSRPFTPWGALSHTHSRIQQPLSCVGGGDFLYRSSPGPVCRWTTEMLLALSSIHAVGCAPSFQSSSSSQAVISCICYEVLGLLYVSPRFTPWGGNGAGSLLRSPCLFDSGCGLLRSVHSFSWQSSIIAQYKDILSRGSRIAPHNRFYQDFVVHHTRQVHAVYHRSTLP